MGVELRLRPPATLRRAILAGGAQPARGFSAPRGFNT